MSPACMREDTGFPRECIWCKAHEGHQDHMMWTCAQRRKKLQRPEDPLQARLGWPTGTPGSDKADQQIMDWFEEVAKETWRRRYDSRGEKLSEREEEEGREENEEDEEDAEAEEEEKAESEEEGAEEDEEDEQEEEEAKNPRRRKRGSKGSKKKAQSGGGGHRPGVEKLAPKTG